MDEFCEKCSAIKDPTQRQACEICRSGEKEVSVDDTTDVDWRCEQCEPEYAASEDRRTCICECCRISHESVNIDVIH